MAQLNSKDYLPHTVWSKRMDRVADQVGRVISYVWLVLLAVIVINVLMRYLFNECRIEMEELQCRSSAASLSPRASGGDASSEEKEAPAGASLFDAAGISPRLWLQSSGSSPLGRAVSQDVCGESKRRGAPRVLPPCAIPGRRVRRARMRRCGDRPETQDRGPVGQSVLPPRVRTMTRSAQGCLFGEAPAGACPLMGIGVPFFGLWNRY